MPVDTPSQLLNSPATHCSTVPVGPFQPADEFVPLNNAPFFPGGPQALQKFLEHPELYPHLARDYQLEGTVRVQFRVQASGHLTDIQVVQSKGPLLDDAAMQVVALMPNWYPAHRNGVAIPYRVELLVTFHLD